MDNNNNENQSDINKKQIDFGQNDNNMSETHSDINQDMNINQNQEFNRNEGVNPNEGLNQRQGFNQSQGVNQSQSFNRNQRFNNMNSNFNNPGGFNQNQGYNRNNRFVLSDRDIKMLRHDAEMPLYRTLQVVNALFVVFVIIVFIFSFRSNADKIADTFNKTIETYQDDSQIDTAQIEQEIPTNVQLFVTIIFIVPYLLFLLAYTYAQVRARSVKITPNQFPEVYRMIEEYAYKYNMPVPEAYVVQENGVLNAFSSFVVRRKYIQINADLFEVAYREYNDLGSIGFVVGHEMAHIKLGHASLPYQLSIIWGNIIPFLGQAASRSREYSCDRLAQVVSGNDGVEALMSLTVGKHLYKRVNVQDYIYESMKINGFFVGLYNLLSTHPILPKRLKALVIKNRSGDLF